MPLEVNLENLLAVLQKVADSKVDDLGISTWVFQTMNWMKSGSVFTEKTSKRQQYCNGG